MTDFKPEHLAKEAERLLHDAVLIEAIRLVQQDAMSGLADADADNKTQILRLQSQVQVCSEILTKLEGMILSHGQNSDPHAGTIA